MKLETCYDVVVVGAGHAGAEAAMAAANLGMQTLLITQNLDAICQMSCNPAMGGVAKGQIVREIDALGGFSGIITDQSMIQFRMLNRSKGPAMWSPRAQCDKFRFSFNWRHLLENTPNLSLWQDEVIAVDVVQGRVSGVRTRMGIEIEAQAVVLTNGTFLNGQIYIGTQTWDGGRIGERPAVGLSDQLLEMGFEVERLKTGTPVRIDGRTIDFTQLEPQPGDENPSKFSFSDTLSLQEQRPCFLAYTNLVTHEILKTGFDRSPLYTGRIQGHGPRYCPSIEDKIVRFASKERHQLFVEPEGWNSQSFYLNGFSSSLPLEVQLDALHSIKGFENARIFKPGYAIEYDYFPPTQLNYSLETKKVENLYFAGQINGTTGYEEAACQGLMAGINASLKVKGKDPFVLNRTQAYIGVLIDDLVTKGVDEPYRMFTSRAEYRILLRQDNADSRLTPLSHSIGLASDSRMRRVEEKEREVARVSSFIEETPVLPSAANALLEQKQTPALQQKVKLLNLLLRPEITLEDLQSIDPELEKLIVSVPAAIRSEVAEESEILLKYQRYIEKERDVASKILKFEDIALPSDFDYFSLQALSYEAREKLTKMKPATIGQASRISGVSPADVSVLIIYLTRQ
ncbi:MAG: tRNA uridine-5-carboxymethylaminomethyl(34) synthesis enzyme MnmG [Bacteroidales bacterium]|nr:tRNA uridine-5-carboxymethylaminomethyl(34) synthesis enzyme MnmG [Candidatus Colimorpha pelethequi]